MYLTGGIRRLANGVRDDFVGFWGNFGQNARGPTSGIIHLGFGEPKRGGGGEILDCIQSRRPGRTSYVRAMLCILGGTTISSFYRLSILHGSPTRHA